MTMYRGKALAYYLGLAILLVLIMTETLSRLIPSGIATSIGHNSESLLFAMGFAGMVQFGLPWARRRQRIWCIAVPCAVVLFALGYALIHLPLPSTVVTLNEPVIALGFMALYVAIPRPFPYAVGLSILVLLFIIVFFHTGFVLSQAESLVPLLLAPLALDIFDRTILELDRPNARGLRIVWVVLLFAVAVGLIIANRAIGDDLDSPLRVAINYAQRAAEAYWGWILVHIYFGFWIAKYRGSCAPRVAASVQPGSDSAGGVNE